MIEKYTAYGLAYENPAQFGLEPYYTELQKELVEFINIEQQGRLFLERPLSSAEKQRIQPETLATAINAEVFQQQVSKIAIQENFEALVNLRSLPEQQLAWSFSDTPYHQACGDWAGKERLFYVRAALAEALVRLETMAESIGYALHFEDAFRPTGVQEGLFQRRIEMAKAQSPDLSDDDILLEAKSKTAFTPRIAAHKAGAAVDVRRRDIASNTLVDIGHEYPEGGELVRLDTPYVTREQWKNRKILAFLAQKANLAMYPYEDWHLCIGDATAAVVRGEQSARYGPIRSFDTDGSITKIYHNDELDQPFNTLQETL